MTQSAKRHRREWLVLVGTVILVGGALAGIGQFQAGNVRPDYLISVLFTVCVYAILALGLSVEMGYAGLLNFGHVAFMGLGAYVMAIFTLRQRDTLVPMLTGATPAAVVVVTLIALLLGAVVYIPSLLLLQRVKPLRSRALWIALVPALVAAGLAWSSMWPLGARGALSAVVFLGVLLGVVTAAVAGLALGLTALRLREDHLAIITLGAAESFRLVATNEEWLTQGTQGIQSLPRPVFDWATHTQWWRDFSAWLGVRSPTSVANAALALICVAFAFLILETLARAPWGRVLKAIREDEEVASALGKNTLLYKLQSLMLGSALAAIAGILFVWNLANVYPEHFLSIVTFYTFAILVLGGVGNHKGAILGAVIIWGILELGANLSIIQGAAGPIQSIFVGLVLILVVVLRPQGAVGSKEEMTLGK